MKPRKPGSGIYERRPWMGNSATPAHVCQKLLDKMRCGVSMARAARECGVSVMTAARIRDGKHASLRKAS